MNLIDTWNNVPKNDEFILLDEEGNEVIRVVKRGSFGNLIRRLSDMTSDENILSDRWRWRVR